MKILITLSITLLLLSSSFTFAQSGNSISGSIIDEESKPIPYASLILYSALDSLTVKFELTDEEGRFIFNDIPQAAYWLTISYVGHPNYNTEVFDLKQDLEIPVVQLLPSSNQLEAVTVVAQRPLLEMKPDKMVFNVDGSINAVGSDAMELLRKAPGVVVDNNDQISMLGKSGVQVYIDGKPSPLAGDDLAAYLRSIQSSDIDNIEIITNPSSKFDAEGSAGIINIRLKKDKRLGANANFNAGYAVGQRDKYYTSINSNFKTRSFNLFGNYSYSDGENVNYMNLYREQLGFVLDQRNDQTGEWRNHNFKAGADFFLDKHNTLGIMVNGNLSDNKDTSASRTIISMEGNNFSDSILIARSFMEGQSDNLNFNLNYRFDNLKGKTWNMDADYGLYRSTGAAYQPNRYYDAAESKILSERNYRNNTPTDIDIYTFKIDHERPLLKGNLGAGLKSAYVKTDNTFEFYNIIDGQDQYDYDQSNQFTYTENVNAAYANYSRQLDKLGFQVGLRVEQTFSEGELISEKPSEDDHVKRDYIDVFPSAGITYQLNEKNAFQLSYSRRINRPNYQDLNPFENKLDELTFEKGNPWLNPEYTNNFQLTHTYNYSINTSIGYSHTKDLITRFTDTADVTSSFITWLNLAEQKDYNINVSGSIPIYEWWSSYTNLTGYHRRNKAEIEAGKTVNLNVTTFNMYSQHTFRLPWALSLEVSGWYSTPSIWGGTFKMDDMWSVDAGIQKKLFDGRGNIKVSVSDIFKTNNWSGISSYGALYMDVNGGYDSRRLKVHFSYLFGNKQVKSRKRSSGLEEESNRIKSD